jgi:FAD/FMN-containing dehydrogenase
MTTTAQLPTIIRRAHFGGQVLTPGSGGYDSARSVWNAMIDHRPELIARCASIDDVVAAVRTARECNLEIGVRCGGHNIAGLAVPDGGLMIDLTTLARVTVDPVTRRAWVQGGAMLGALDRATQSFGLATTAGNVSHTGVGGLTLGGGMGWLARQHGLTCDNVVSCTVVTADGNVVRASADEHPDLFWGLRGGGGNFGIVTQFELDLHPLGPMVYAGPIFYPADAAGDLLRTFRNWAPGASDDVTALVSLTTAPPLPVIPEEWHGRKVAILVAASTGTVDEGAGLVAELRQVAEPIADLLGPMPYHVIQTLLDPLWPKGIQAYFKATNLARLDDELIHRLGEIHLAAPGPQCEIHVHQMGGAVGRVAGDATAFGERPPFVLNAVTGWYQESEGEAHTHWARRVVDEASDASTGRAYVNFLGDPDAAKAAYGEETYARLVSLKNDYDPTNVFRLNQNIEPSNQR